MIFTWVTYVQIGTAWFGDKIRGLLVSMPWPRWPWSLWVDEWVFLGMQMSISRTDGEGHGVCSWVSETHKSRASVLWRLHPMAGLPSPRHKMSIWMYWVTQEALWISLGLPWGKEERRKVKRLVNVQRRRKRWLVWKLSSTIDSSMLRKYTWKRCMKRETTKPKHDKKTPQRTVPT